MGKALWHQSWVLFADLYKPFVGEVGIFLVRRRGLRLLFNARKNMYEGVMPTNEIKGGIFLLISGLLLITPGFFTDCVGFAVFLKPVQDFIALRAKNYFTSRTRRY